MVGMTGHSYTDRIYGYRKYDTKEALGEALSELFEKQIPQSGKDLQEPFIRKCRILRKRSMES